MARITTNTTGTQPCIIISSNVAANGNNYTATFDATKDIIVPQIQDITITNATGVFSYTTFSDVDTRKLSTPADNTISTNVVIDDTTWFGNGTVTTGNAKSQGLQYLSGNKVLVGFKMYWNDDDGNGTGARFRQGVGFITNLAPSVSPDAPVWVTPLEIAVDNFYTDGVNSAPPPSP
jgi:hypothetical protein